MIVLGIDAALCNFGIAAMELDPQGALSDRIVELQVLRTEPSPKKRRVLVIEDDARRVGELAAGLHAAIEKHQPVVLVVEATGAGKGSKAVRAMALAFSAVVTIARLRGLPLLQVSPLDVKRAMVGRKSAEKGEIILAVERRFSDFEWPDDVPQSCWEHAADAVGAVVAALDTEVCRMARRMSVGGAAA